MPRKIYDIKPPKVVKKTEKDIKEFMAEPKIKRVTRSSRPVRSEPKTVYSSSVKKEKRSIKWPIVVGVLAVVAIFGGYLFVKLPKADIIIWPVVEILSFNQTITADKSVDSVNIEDSTIPIKYFQSIKTNAQDFPSTGNADNTGKATGTVTIFNKCNPPASLSIVKGINFLSNNSKVFTTLQKKFVIPAATKSGSKIIPSSIQTKVEAAEGGDSYNIAPANFSAPGLNGTVYFSCIYATSDSPMTGGYAGKVKKVTAEDIALAKDVLSKKTTADAIADLKSQIPEGYVLLESAVLTDTTKASTTTKAGTVAENFNYTVTVQASALAFKKSDLDKFAKDYILSQMPEGKTLLEDSFKIEYSSSTIDVSGGKAVFKLDFSSGVYQDIDKNSMILSMLGKNADQIKETVNNSLGDQVSNTTVEFWPFWVKSAPNNQKAVNIELKFE